MYYVDVDGVVADFEGWISNFGSFSEDDWRYGTKPWKILEENIGVAYLCLEPTNLLPMFENLYNTHPTKFLTALPKTWFGTELWEQGKKNKIDWLKQNIKNFQKEDCIITPGPFAKLEYCKPGDFLFDDRYDTIEKWNNAGGIGIRVAGCANKEQA